MDCYDTALRYSKERIQFDKPIAGTQLQQKKLAEMITEITKAQLLTWRLGVLRNEGKATTAQISMAKRNNVDMAINIAREARQIRRNGNYRRIFHYASHDEFRICNYL
jgi:glutaryl-CoA dehydrogenase